MLPWRPVNESHQSEMIRSSNEQQQNLSISSNQTSNSPIPPSSLPPTQSINLASTLFFLQSEHRRYNRDRNEWEIERAEMRARLALLEGEKRGNEGALRDLGRRCKMLEAALRNERAKFLSTTNAHTTNLSPTPSGTSSPMQFPTGTTSIASGIPPLTKVALLSTKDVTLPSNETSTSNVKPIISIATASPILESGHPTRTASAASGTSMNGANGSMIGGGATGNALNVNANGPSARDPRGKARSRDYLKQCLQEITYLTASTTLNPLSSASYSTPAIPRPRKTLAEQNLPSVGILPLPSTSTTPLQVYPVSTNQSGMYLNGSIRSTTTSEINTNYPSDPASVFVPLKRQVSLQGSRSLMGGDVPVVEEETIVESKLESGPTTTSMMALKPPIIIPTILPNPSIIQSNLTLPISSINDKIESREEINSIVDSSSKRNSTSQKGEEIDKLGSNSNINLNLNSIPSSKKELITTNKEELIEKKVELLSGLVWEGTDGNLSDKES